MLRIMHSADERATRTRDDAGKMLSEETIYDPDGLGHRSTFTWDCT